MEQEVRDAFPGCFFFAVDGTCAWRGQEEAFCLPLPARGPDEAVNVAQQFLTVLFKGAGPLPDISVQATRRLGGSQ